MSSLVHLPFIFHKDFDLDLKGRVVIAKLAHFELNRLKLGAVFISRIDFTSVKHDKIHAVRNLFVELEEIILSRAEEARAVRREVVSLGFKSYFEVRVRH
jgi:hypothetical protein